MLEILLGYSFIKRLPFFFSNILLSVKFTKFRGSELKSCWSKSNLFCLISTSWDLPILGRLLSELFWESVTFPTFSGSVFKFSNSVIALSIWIPFETVLVGFPFEILENNKSEKVSFSFRNKFSSTFETVEVATVSSRITIKFVISTLFGVVFSCSSSIFFIIPVTIEVNIVEESCSMVRKFEPVFDENVERVFWILIIGDLVEACLGLWIGLLVGNSSSNKEMFEIFSCSNLFFPEFPLTLVEFENIERISSNRENVETSTSLLENSSSIEPE